MVYTRALLDVFPHPGRNLHQRTELSCRARGASRRRAGAVLARGADGGGGVGGAGCAGVARSTEARAQRRGGATGAKPAVRINHSPRTCNEQQSNQSNETPNPTCRLRRRPTHSSQFPRTEHGNRTSFSVSFVRVRMGGTLQQVTTCGYTSAPTPQHTHAGPHNSLLTFRGHMALCTMRWTALLWTRRSLVGG